MQSLPQTRQSLLIELRKHSGVAWIEFLQVYESAIIAYCRTMGLQHADALDATQEVFAAVYKRIPTWDHSENKGSFRAWMFRVARNVAVDLIVARTRRSSTNADSQIERVLDGAVDPRQQHEATLDRVYRRALFEWVAGQVKLEVRAITWQAFELTAIQGQRAEEVAAQLGISIGSVYTAKCRVIARFRSRVSHYENAMRDDGDSEEMQTRAAHSLHHEDTHTHEHDGFQP